MWATDPSAAYLLGRLAVVESRVRLAVARRRRTDPWPDDGFRGLYVADDQVDQLLASERVGLEVASPEIAELAADVEARAEAAAAAGRHLRLRHLRQAFGLLELDVEVLLVALAPDLDPRFEKLYGYLHDDVTRRRASTGLAIELAGASPLDPAARSRFGAAAPLALHGLLAVDDPAGPFLSRALRVPDRVAVHLLGHDEPDPLLRGLLTKPTPLRTPGSERLARALAAGVRLAYLRQQAGLDAGATAVAAFAELGWQVLAVELSQTPAADALMVVQAAIREARLLGRGLVAGPLDGLDRGVFGLFADTACPTVLFGAGGWDADWSAEVPLVLDLERPGRRLQEATWRSALQELDQGTPALDGLASFRMAPGQIRRAVASASALASADGEPLGWKHLAGGARLQNGIGLERLARHIEPSVGWDDLVLPDATLAGLRHLADRVAHRDRLLDDWQLRRGGGRGEGVTALFVGDSGTGKTMAAEVIAGALGLDLYVIDLATVVDKYVGETEKNLERVFAGAEGVNGVLFFDEADALFGKRSEVSDARDRYANIETAYLLQRMEAFDGLAILATNLKANLDEAFARRLSLMVEFVQPDVTERRLLWPKCLAAVPLDEDVDLDFCARAFRLAGGDIRNIAITAACLAAAAGGLVGMPQLIRAVQLEYRKLGRLCVEAEFGPYFPLLQAARL
jgi:hypothetical protein